MVKAAHRITNKVPKKALSSPLSQQCRSKASGCPSCRSVLGRNGWPVLPYPTRAGTVSFQVTGVASTRCAEEDMSQCFTDHELTPQFPRSGHGINSNPQSWVGSHQPVVQPLLQHPSVLVMNLQGDRLPSRDLGTLQLRARRHRRQREQVGGKGFPAGRGGAAAAERWTRPAASAQAGESRMQERVWPQPGLKAVVLEWVKENSHRKTIWQEF